MRLLSWNCRGLGNPWTVRALNKLIKQKGPNLVFLMETRRKANELMRFRYKGGICNIVGVECEGEGRSKAGGLACMWDNSIQLEVVLMFTNHIDMHIKMGDGEQA